MTQRASRQQIKGAGGWLAGWLARLLLLAGYTHTILFCGHSLWLLLSLRVVYDRGLHQGWAIGATMLFTRARPVRRPASRRWAAPSSCSAPTTTHKQSIVSQPASHLMGHPLLQPQQQQPPSGGWSASSPTLPAVLLTWAMVSASDPSANRSSGLNISSSARKHMRMDEMAMPYTCTQQGHRHRRMG